MARLARTFPGLLARSGTRPVGEGVPFRSPAIGALEGRFSPERKSRVLDLGPASGANLAFFSENTSRLFVADFYQNLLKFPAESRLEPGEFANIVTEILPFPDDARFDTILAWDLLDYLSLDQIEVLSGRLAKLAELGTVLLALVSIRSQIPLRPMAYEIVDRQTLRYESRSAAFRAGPRYKEPDLCRRMPGFRVQSTFLLRHGIQEYLFVFDQPVIRPKDRAAWVNGSAGPHP